MNMIDLVSIIITMDPVLKLRGVSEEEYDRGILPKQFIEFGLVPNFLYIIFTSINLYIVFSFISGWCEAV